MLDVSISEMVDNLLKYPKHLEEVNPTSKKV